MSKYGIDISQNKSNNVLEYKDIEFDYVITVCDIERTLPWYFHLYIMLFMSLFLMTIILIMKIFSILITKGTDEELVKIYSEVCKNLKIYFEQFVKKYLS